MPEGRSLVLVARPALTLVSATQYLVTCEHGGNQVPAAYADLFQGHEALLNSHRGHDPGALTLARELAAALQAPLVYSTVSRLLVELNRSPGHPRLFSDLMRHQPESVKQAILDQYYQPYRMQVEEKVQSAIENQHRIIHISSHSFTPELDGNIRNADIGLLYDPSRAKERKLCLHWQKALSQALPKVRVRRNYPYTGTSDGMCTFLRKYFSGDYYLGIELEVNQKYVVQDGADWQRLRSGIVESLMQALSKTL